MWFEFAVCFRARIVDFGCLGILGFRLLLWFVCYVYLICYVLLFWVWTVPQGLLVLRSLCRWVLWSIDVQIFVRSFTL